MKARARQTSQVHFVDCDRDFVFCISDISGHGQLTAMMVRAAQRLGPISVHINHCRAEFAEPRLKNIARFP